MAQQHIDKPIRSFIHGDTVTTYWSSGNVTVQKSKDYFRSLSSQYQQDDDGQYDFSSDYSGYAE